MAGESTVCQIKVRIEDLDDGGKLTRWESLQDQGYSARDGTVIPSSPGRYAALLDGTQVARSTDDPLYTECLRLDASAALRGVCFTR